MKLQQNSYGFAHQLMLAGALVVFVIGGVFITVYRANYDKNTKANAELASSSSSTKKVSTNANTLKGVGVIQTGTQPSTASTNSAAPSVSHPTSTPTSSSTVSSTPAGSSPSSSSAAAPAPTPLSTLTALITSVKNGAQANVTASDVDVPAAVSGTVKARPIVFIFNDATYMAYTRVNPPNFTTSADATANSMAIVVASGSAPLVQAHLDKASNLVDPNFQLVGYTPSNN